MAVSADIYQQVVLQHNKNPKNFKVLEDASDSAMGHNPLCGDKLVLYIKTEGEILTDISFKGEGCAIFKATSSMMTEILKGKSLNQIKVIVKEYELLVKGELDPEQQEHHLEKLRIFSGIYEYPARVKCAILCFRTLQSMLEDDKKEAVISTE